jgi:hypothetical protein
MLKLRRNGERGERARERRKLGIIIKKGKGWPSRWRYGRSRCAGLVGDIQQKHFKEALWKTNSTNKGLGSSGQNALEKMKRDRNKY